MSNQPNPSASGECCSFSKRVSWHIDFHFEHGDEVIHLVPKFCPWCGTPKTQPAEQINEVSAFTKGMQSEEVKGRVDRALKKMQDSADEVLTRESQPGQPQKGQPEKEPQKLGDGWYKDLADGKASDPPQVSDAARTAYETEISRDSSRERAGYLVPEKGLAIQRVIDDATERATAPLEKQLADSNNLIEQVCVVFLSPPSREQLPRIVHELNKQLAEAREEVAKWQRETESANAAYVTARNEDAEIVELRKELDCWLSNAKGLQKQVNEWEPERAKLISERDSLRQQLEEAKNLAKHWEGVSRDVEKILSKQIDDIRALTSLERETVKECLALMKDYQSGGQDVRDLLDMVKDWVEADSHLEDGEYEGADGLSDVVQWLRNERDELNEKLSVERQAFDAQTQELESSQRREAAMREALQCVPEWIRSVPEGVNALIEAALGPDAGQSFVPKSEVEKLQAELFKVREERDSAKRMYEELNAAATNKRDDTP